MSSLLKKASSFISSRRGSIGNQLGDEPLSTEAKSLLVGIDIHKPILTGRVFKQSQDGKQFNKRFFVLYPKVLLYFQNERTYQNSLKRGKIESGCKVFKLKGLHVSLVKPLPPGAEFCFRIHLPDAFNPKNEVLLAFHNRRAKRKWMMHLQAQNPNLVLKRNS
ncbi:PREDICTED: uncharacterized protein LOC100642007 [Amphimedon queenslandica]|uniref:PH domain-containing protein n=1 Tax=Amphimedon queenslandica TaxID=400682 RepID=A0A1X7VAL2_AMPQE|nr:PREDICTED: uncharacterized protein LOC100642007 [Amphimedon queenslandica]|eukprot:XP_003385199.1 PREDICTED: uncharacterized protein LOC100642007 [Amphimedon queenslandica]